MCIRDRYVPVRGGESPAVEERFEQRERKGHRTLPPIEWGFDVQFPIEQPNKPVDMIAADIAAMGDCPLVEGCLLYTSDAADQRSRVDPGGRRIIKKKKHKKLTQ